VSDAADSRVVDMQADVTSGVVTTAAPPPSATEAVSQAGARQPRSAYAVKRFIDYAGAGLGSLVLSPLFALIAIAIKLDSPGPVLFRQTRVGKDGRLFTFYKFRSMDDGCDTRLHEQHVRALIRGEACEDVRAEDGSFKLQQDPRVTRVGRVLRATSFDEFPQLLNVLKGDMSLVGPRPPLPYEVECYTPRHLRRLESLPGITGLWQVSGRTQLSFEEMVDLDIQYADEWSLGSDVVILARTIPAVLSRAGAG
jgi:lipopolysaccharide/colanic/teichoic acid biosynthesis glycosyltransferase